MIPNSEYINLFTFVHFILWFIIGLLYPNKYGLVIILSFLWEFIEWESAQHPMVHSLLKKYWFVPEKYWNEEIGNKITDILSNVAGYYFASIITQHSANNKHLFCGAVVLYIIALIYAK
jgi:hypothetical protein